MPIRFSWEELGRTVVAPTTNVVLNRAGLGLDEMCEMYRNSPFLAIPFAINAPATRALRAAWDSLCNPRGELPPAPQVPFTGGQCPVSYNVVVNWVGQSALISGACVDRSGVGNGSIVGPITLLGTDRINGPGTFRLNVRFRGGNGQIASISTSNFSDSCGGGRITSITATRIDGQPDVCGNPPIQFPPVPITNYETEITENYNDGTSLTLPVVFAPVTAVANVNGSFDVNIDGINFNFDAGGVTIDLGRPSGGSDNSFTSDDRDTINNISEEVTNIRNEVEQECDNTEVLEAIAALRALMVNRFDSLDKAVACVEAVSRFNSPLKATEVSNRSTVGLFQATFDDNVLTLDLPAPNVSYMAVEVLDPLPQSVRVYKLTGDDEQIEFGAGNVSYGKFVNEEWVTPGVTQLFSRYTLVELPSNGEDFILRISLRAGVLVQVWDLGYRWEKEVIPTCQELLAE